MDRRLFEIRQNLPTENDVESTVLRRERRREPSERDPSFGSWVHGEREPTSSGNSSPRVLTTRITMESDTLDSEIVAHPLVAVETMTGSGRRTDSVSWREVEFLVDSQLYLFLGGHRKDQEKGHRSPMLRLDVKQMKWVDLGRMPVARRNAAIVSNRRGEVFVTGGYGFTFERQRLMERVTNTVLRYGGREEPRWGRMKPMSVARASHSAAIVSDVLVVVGGVDEDGR